MLSAVMFDLFETLITEYDPCFVPGPSLAARLCVSQSVFEQGWGELQAARLTGKTDYAGALRDICAREGVQPSDRQIELLCRERLRLKARPLREIEPTIIELLHGLRDAGLKLGVISNAAAEDVAAWPNSALARRFDCAVFSYQAGFAKPHPRIYGIACEALQVEPREAAFVGDGGSSELCGATAAGLRAYQATWFIDLWPAGVRKEDSVASAQDRYARVRSTGELEMLLRQAMSESDPARHHCPGEAES